MAMIEAFGWGVLGASALVLGALLGVIRPWPARLVGLVLGFGAGALISAVSFDLALRGLRAGGLVAVAIGLAAGALTFFVLDGMLDRLAKRRAASANVNPDASISLAVGAVLDGIPENLVLGVGIAREGGVSWALLVAIFVQNLPEGMGSAIGWQDAGARPWRICAGWAGVAIVTALAAPAGFALAEVLANNFSGAFNGFAAGALLVMLVDSMAPEARRKAGRSAGLATTVGFALGVALSGLS
jgi:zinc transporter, ZIP family